MTYEQFLDEVPSYLTGRFPADTRIHIRTVLKNNDRKLDGLVICEPGNTLSPTIYLNGFYNRIAMGEASFEDVMDDVMMLYRNNRPAKDLDVNFFADYQQVKPMIIYKLVSKDRNTALLSDVPYVEYLDLAVVFEYLIEEGDGNTSSILIHNSHCKLWNVTADDLWQVASENTPRLLPYVLRPMADVLEDMTSFPLDEGLKMALQMHPLYVISNGKRIHGAATMLYPNVLSEFAKCLNCDFYIVPSSIHELVFIPTLSREGDKELTEMIATVNATEVRPEDVLSDHPYYYSKADGEITYGHC